MKTKLITMIFLLLAFSTNAQVKNPGLPFIINYSPDQYRAHKQNWSCAEDKRGVMYFGNSSGVLEFDGQNWRLIPLPNNSLVRSLAADDKGRIYVGSRGDFGYLIPDSIGTMSFHSLFDKIENKEHLKFGDIGRILISKGIVYFICEEFVFEFANGSVKSSRIAKLKQAYEVNNQVFVRIDGEDGCWGEFKNGKVDKIPGSEIYKDLSLRAVLPYGEKLLFVTMADGLFIYDYKKLEKLKTGIDEFLKKENVLSVISLSDGNYALGLFSSGLLIIDKFGKVIQHLNINTGLQNGQIPNLMEDSNGNLWLCTSNGISYVLTSLPISVFSGLYDLNSTTYDAFYANNHLYLASSTGLFYRKWDGFENHLNQIERFQKLGEPMNIWNLDTLSGLLLAATNKGISIIDKNKISDLKINERITVWKFLRIHGNSNYILAGTNKGFILLENALRNKKNDSQNKKNKNTINKAKWTFKTKVKGFEERCRHIVIDDKNQIWFSDKSKGVARLVLQDTYDSVTTFWYNENKGLPEDEEEKFVIQLKNDILIGTDRGLFVYDLKKDSFIYDQIWNPIIGTGVKIILMTEDSKGNIWFKQERENRQTNETVFELGQLFIAKDGSYELNKTPFYKFKNSIYAVYPSMDGNLIIGTDKGFIHYDPKVKKDYKQAFRALIRKVEFVTNDSLIFDGAFSDTSGHYSVQQNPSDILSFPYRYNNIRFTFSAPFFDDPEQIKFKFYLDDNDEGWSDWKTKNFKEYSNLREGDYVFHVIAKNIYGIESEESVYYFKILPPWYRTIWAIIGYGIAIVLLIWGIVRLSVRRLRLQKEYLERVVEERTTEIRMKNVELEQQKEEILAQRDEIEVQKDKIEEKNKNITASITYAKRIQEAMLPLREKIDQAFDDYFILFKPRDIVSGDFYWFATKNNKIIFTAVDCTGHGVPGAFMSMIGSEILTTIVNQGITIPAEILDYKNRYIRKALKQDQTENQDGMDMSLCTIDKHTKIVEWAGAKNPLIYIQNNELFHIKGDMQSIGGHQLSKKERQFTNYEVSYANGDTYFYIFTDGYQDQFGGDKGRKFMVKSMKDLIFEHYLKPMKEQHQILDAAIEDWKRNAEQTDDILVIGFKLTP